MQKQYTESWREHMSKFLWRIQSASTSASKRQQAAAAAGTAPGTGIATNTIATASPRDASPSPYNTANPHLKPSAMQQPARPYPHQGYDGQGMHPAYDSSTTSAGNRPHSAANPQMRGNQQQQNMHGTSHGHQQYMMYPTMNRPERCALPLLPPAMSSRSPRDGPQPPTALTPECAYASIQACIALYLVICSLSPGMGG